MSVFQRVHMPSLDGATGWVKSDPPGPAGLRGHVVLVNFWTLTCINWLRREPTFAHGREPATTGCPSLGSAGVSFEHDGLLGDHLLPP